MGIKPNFKLSTGSYTVSKFSSGEMQVTLVEEIDTLSRCTITGSILSSDHIIELLQLVEAIRYAGGNYLELVMPYCAFSRQDRRCNKGEAFSLKVFTNLINSCKFDSVITYDNHSLVSTALLDNCTDRPSSDLFSLGGKLHINKYDYLVAPDIGALKKVRECARHLIVPTIKADKVRDPLTMGITHTEVFTTTNKLNSKTVLIVDDICAGGRTFIRLAEELKKIQPNVTIHLYCTHMFAEYGFDAMYKAGITKFITTDSVVSDRAIHSADSLSTSIGSEPILDVIEL